MQSGRGLIFGLVSFLLILSDCSLQANGPRKYANRAFHYALEVPATWRIEARNTVCVLYNFRPNEGGPQALFLEHGAEIYVIPLAAVQATVDATTIDEWASRNASPDHTAISAKHLSGPGRDDSVPNNLLMVEADYERDPQEDLQHEVNYYFSLRASIFRLRLLYWKDDSRAARHRAAVESVLRSIHATG
jgi:hypothetical protein